MSRFDYDHEREEDFRMLDLESAEKCELCGKFECECEEEEEEEEENDELAVV